MKAGYLSDFFGGVGWKRLSAVEVDPSISNGQEFNGSKVFSSILGIQERRIAKGTGIPAKMLYFKEGEDAPLEERVELSWYNTRRKEFYPNAKQKTRSAEFRLFYQRNSVIGESGVARVGDLLIIAFDKEISTATVIIAEQGSTFENQLLWLFGIDSEIGNIFEIHDSTKRTALGLAATSIVESLGITIPVEDQGLLQQLLKRFKNKFPTTVEFSAFARAGLPDIIAMEDPDIAVVRWMEQEELAFRVLEKHLVETRLSDGFKGVDEFISYSLSIQNRRKARAGAGFENHLNAIFSAYKLKFTWKGQVENKSKPDFVFPGIREYWDDEFPDALLTVLGAKTSCKDRWRQVLSEGKRFQRKHLVTLEPSISSTQIVEMDQNALQLVVPKSIHPTYNIRDRKWLWTLAGFIDFVASRQASSKKGDS